MFKNIINYLNPKANKAFVCDGDTIIIYGGIGNYLKKTIRLIGINAPETVNAEKYGRVAEQGGEEAKDYLIRLIHDKYVHIDLDSTVVTDKYGRTLAYIYADLGDNSEDVDIAEAMLLKGMVKVYDYHNNGFDKLDKYKELETIAKNAKVGLWNNKTII
jgi:micrococcal nuclease